MTENGQEYELCMSFGQPQARRRSGIVCMLQLPARKTRSAAATRSSHVETCPVDSRLPPVDWDAGQSHRRSGIYIKRLFRQPFTEIFHDFVVFRGEAGILEVTPHLPPGPPVRYVRNWLDSYQNAPKSTDFKVKFYKFSGGSPSGPIMRRGLGPHPYNHPINPCLNSSK